MTNSRYFSILFISIMMSIFASAFAISSLNTFAYATSSLGQSIQQSQQDLQSTINNQVQQSITNTIDNINNSNDSSVSNIANNQNQNQNITDTSSDVVKGGITSLQYDPIGNSTTWIVGGVYRIENLSSEAPTFNASFYMVKTDGNFSHSHEIYDLFLNAKSTNSSMNNSTHLTGTTTVTMMNGPVSNVPTNITLLDDSAISIWLDPSKVNNHFGDSPIYGTQELKCVDSPAYCK
jgi:hypothetical protein